MKKITCLLLLLPLWCLAQHTGTAVYAAEQNQLVKQILPFMPEVDAEQTLDTLILADRTVHFDSRAQKAHVIFAPFSAILYKKDGSTENYPFDMKSSYYVLDEQKTFFQYLSLPNGYECAHGPKPLLEYSLQYTERDTVIMGYACEEAYYLTSKNDYVYIYTCQDLPKILNPLQIKLHGLRGGVVLSKSLVIGRTLLQSITYKDLPKEATQLPADVEISDEPCRVPR